MPRRKEDQEVIDFLAKAHRDAYPPPRLPDNPHLLKFVTEQIPFLDDNREGSIAYNLLFEHCCSRLLPLYEFFTRPRSIAEFLQLRRQVCHFIIEQLVAAGGDDEFIEFGLMAMVHRLSVIPNPFVGSQTVKDVEVPFFDLRRPRTRHRLSPEKKICADVEKAKRKIEQLERFGFGPVGLAQGKWRVGIHSGQRSLLENAGKVLSPVGGILTVSVESNEAIKIRRGEPAPPLAERIGWVAAQPWVDVVFPVDPQVTEEAKIREYYENIWRTLGLNFYFLGERNHEYFNLFAEWCKRLGAILLWDHETGTTSATELLGALVQADN